MKCICNVLVSKSPNRKDRELRTGICSNCGGKLK